MSEKKKPWFKFSPTRWLGEMRLRLVSRAARSFWLDLMCLMHESPLIGYLYVGDKAPSHEDLARMFGDTPAEVGAMIAELTAAGVCSVTDEGVIYSRGMVRDQEISEKGREDIKRRGGPWGGPKPSLPENTDRTPNRVPNTKSTEYRVQNKDLVGTGVPTVPEPRENPDFEEFWKHYPRTPNMSKQEARKSWAKLAKDGALPEQPRMLSAVEAYKRFLVDQSRNRKEPHAAAHAATWLNQRRYEGFIEQQVQVGGRTMTLATGPGWESRFPKWARIREFFLQAHGSDQVWQNFFADIEAESETKILCRSEMQRDAIIEKFGEKLVAIIGADLDLGLQRSRATH